MRLGRVNRVGGFGDEFEGRGWGDDLGGVAGGGGEGALGGLDKLVEKISAKG